MRRVIRLGDKTTHGGEVVSAADNYFIMGNAVARMGDMATCPIKGHGACEIIEGDPTWTINGRNVALEGHRLKCGATLISSCGEVGRSYEGDGAAGTFGISPASEGKTQFTHDEQATAPIHADDQFIYDEQVRIRDQAGKLMVNVPYHITDDSGNIYKGVTDAQGCCKRVFTENEQSLKIFIGVPALEKW